MTGGAVQIGKIDTFDRGKAACYLQVINNRGRFDAFHVKLAVQENKAIRG